MTDDVKKDDQPKGQVIRLVQASKSAQLLKDLGPNGGDMPASAVQPNAFEPEDEYQQLYVGATRDQGIVQPPYNLRHLDRLTQENNALGPCIEAMVTNIVQTGYKFENQTEETEDDADDTNIEALKAFFLEPWPGCSWSELRRLVRRDLERTGNGYLEFLRNAQDKIVMFRHVDAKMMRLLRLDDAVPVDVTVSRQGVDQTVTVMKRERRYTQLVNGVSLMYFRDFGATRDLHKKTAVWAPKGQRLPASMRATEIMHFTVLPDAHTPYGIPRWVNQTPSVLGSRKAEEFNLEFFEAGGVPPVMVFLQGGTLQAETRKALEQKLSGEAKKKNRVQIFEVEPAGGSLNQPVPTARVTVERFGAERQSDSMFEKYDERCEERVRRAFRLPPIFVGQSKDYNFACYDAETETLTDAGWIKYDGFEPGMKVACYDPKSGALTYQQPIGGALVYDVENVEMHRFKGEGLDMMLTPKHRMHWETPHGKPMAAPIEAMLATCSRPNFVARIDEYPEGEALDDFTPPWVPLASGVSVAYDVRPRPIRAIDFLRLAGWYVSEGCAHPQLTEFSLCQKSSRYWPEIVDVARRLEQVGYAYRIADPNADIRYVHIVNKSLTLWLSRQAGFRSHAMRVPGLIKGLCKAQLQVFFNALLSGDGTWDARDNRNSGAYSTTSKQLADDVQEIAIKLGYRAKLRVEPPGSAGIRAVYRVLLSKGARAGGRGRTQAVRYAEHHSREIYTGKVYCFSVPTGVFVTRRNGVVAVQGNTAFASYSVAEAQVFKPERDAEDTIITMRLLPALGFKGYKIRSLPLSIEDATLKLQAIEVVETMGDQVEPSDIVEAINQIAGLHLKISDAAPTLQGRMDQQAEAAKNALQSQPGQGGQPGQPLNIAPINPVPKAPLGLPKPGGPSAADAAPGQLKPPAPPPVFGGGPPGKPAMTGSAKKADAPESAHALAIKMMGALRKRDFETLASLLPIVNAFDAGGRAAFNEIVGDLHFLDASYDPQGLAELSACTLAVMTGQSHDHAH